MRLQLLKGLLPAAMLLAATWSASADETIRDAGSKIRGDYGHAPTYYNAPRRVVNYPVYTVPQTAVAATAAPANVEARTSAAPSNVAPPIDSTAQSNAARTGTRTLSVEPDAAAPAATYRTSPRRLMNRDQWMFRADSKIMGRRYGG